MDNNDIPYEFKGIDGIEVIQWISTEGSIGVQLIGEIRNVDERRTLTRAEFVVTFYDEDGVILGVNSGYISLDRLPPRETSPFQVISFIPFD